MEINNGHYGELQDRLHVMQVMMTEVIISHPVCCQHKEVQNLLLGVSEQIGKAYQKIGQLEPEEEKS